MGDHPPRAGKSEAPQLRRLRAARWERDVADTFLSWRTTSTVGLWFMRTFGEAIVQTVQVKGLEVARELAATLPAVLASCDDLSFNDTAEALAYAGLHLLDRYGRVDQVLQYLLRIGRLPLRIIGPRVLEVGAGPAPALYATRDFYAALLRWPARGGVKLGPLAVVDPLDRGRAWDWFLYQLSESLMSIRGGSEDGHLAFGRSVDGLEGFDVRERHRRGIENRAASIVREFDDANEWISDGWARQLASESGVAEPSAYDLVFLGYFLTHESMTKRFELELRGLASSLTPGGLLIVIGGTGSRYPELYSQVRGIASGARLLDVSPNDPLQANSDPGYLPLIADHVRGNVAFAMQHAPPQERSGIKKALRKELLDKHVRFRLPRFQALIFVNQAPPHRGNPQKWRRRS